MNERRISRRYEIWFPMRFDAQAVSDGLAVSHNISATGILMATAAKLDVGGPVTVVFQVTPKDPQEHRVEGRIIRVEANAADPEGLWPMRVAVAFDDAMPQLEPLLAELDTLDVA